MMGCMFSGKAMDQYLAGLVGTLTAVRALNLRTDELESTSRATVQTAADHEDRLLDLEESSLHSSSYYEGELAQSKVCELRGLL